STFHSPRELTESTLSYTVARNGHHVRLTMPDSLLDEIKHIVFLGPHNLLLPAKISSVKSGSPADSAGLKAGDKIVAINGKLVNSWQQMAGRIGTAQGTLSLTIARDSDRLIRNVAPNKNHIIGIFGPNPHNVFDVQHI